MARCLVVDLDRCTGCESCVVACKHQNNIPLGIYWSHVVPVGPIGKHPDIKMYWVPFQCQQCEDAPCIETCPTAASYRDQDSGVVLIDKETCIGCKTCLAACPYSDPTGLVKPSVRWFNEAEQVVEKCTLCNHITAKSDGNINRKDGNDAEHALPPCVMNCTTGARFFGDLDDPNSGASKAIAAAKAQGKGIHTITKEGVKPTACFILSEKTAPWIGLGE